MTHWVVNTDEAELEGRGADEKMVRNSCVAAWKDPNEEPDWAFRKLSKPVAGDVVFLYKKEKGIIAMGVFDHTNAFPSNNIFGLQGRGEFSRRVVDLRINPARRLGCSEIKAATGRDFRPLSTMFSIKIPGIVAFIESSFPTTKVH